MGGDESYQNELWLKNKRAQDMDIRGPGGTGSSQDNPYRANLDN